MVKRLQRTIAVLISVTITTNVTADEIGVGLGYGYLDTDLNRAVTVEYVKHLSDQFMFRKELTFYVDRRPGARMSLLNTTQMGARVGLAERLDFRLFTGAGLISHPDQYNGGRFQFVHEARLDFSGTNDTGIYLGVKHISNAGIAQPNFGRDHITFGVRFNLD